MRRKITDVLDEWADSDERKALMICGPRQVGKTYSISEFGRRRFGRHFLEINLQDSPEDCRMFDGDLDVDTVIRAMSARYRDFEFIPGKTLIFLDEIQNCPRARTALKPFAVDGRYRVVASGSLLGVRLGEVPLNPTGYMRLERMFPMDYEEFLWALGMPQEAIDDVRSSIRDMEPMDGSLFSTFSDLHRQYMVVGGMPAAVEAFVRTHTFHGLRRVFNELFEGFATDIDKYAGRRDRTLTRDCLDSIPLMLAGENKRFRFNNVPRAQAAEGTGAKAVGFTHFAPALNWLSLASITLQCSRVSEPVNPLEERCSVNMFKLYMFDTGALVSRYDDSVFAEVYSGNAFANLGAIAENAVAQALASQGRRLMYLSKESGLEVDFVTVVQGMPCCVEVKSGDNRHCRSLNKAMADYGCLGVMFETRNIFTDDKGVRHYPLFAASFMDAVDPRPEIRVDLSALDRMRERYGGTSDPTRRGRGESFKNPGALPVDGMDARCAQRCTSGSPPRTRPPRATPSTPR